MTLKELGATVRARRAELGLTQDELATRAGFKNRASIAKIEAGDRDLPRSKIAKLAEALNVSPQYLMGWGDDEDHDYKGLVQMVVPRTERWDDEYPILLSGLDEADRKAVISYVRLIMSQDKYKNNAEVQSILQYLD